MSHYLNYSESLPKINKNQRNVNKIFKLQAMDHNGLRNILAAWPRRRGVTVASRLWLHIFKKLGNSL